VIRDHLLRSSRVARGGKTSRSITKFCELLTLCKTNVNVLGYGRVPATRSPLNREK